MYYYATFISFVALLAANQVVGVAMKQTPDSVAGIQIATNPFFACNKPNNPNHREGSSCKFYSGPSDKTAVISGKCEFVQGSLICIA